MRVSFVGVRGVPALYSGFETAATEIGTRLVQRGHSVTVYCRHGYGDQSQPTYRGITKRYLPSLRSKNAETLSHTFLALIDVIRNPPDVLIVFNPANAPFCLLARLRRIPVALNVDGLEWQRGKWSRLGRTYFYLACWLSTRTVPWLIADSRAIQRFYLSRWRRNTYYATYGSYLRESLDPTPLTPYNLTPNGYFLVVARLQPENNPDLIVEAFRHVRSDQQLVVVGDTRYKSHFVDTLRERTDDSRVRFLGGIYDQAILHEIICNSFVYVHGHMVGGTNPILLQALGCGACVLYLDDAHGFNREVVDNAGLPFQRDREHLRAAMQTLVDQPHLTSEYRARARARVRSAYTWDAATTQYEQLCLQMLKQNGFQPPGVATP